MALYIILAIVSAIFLIALGFLITYVTKSKKPLSLSSTDNEILKNNLENDYKNLNEKIVSLSSALEEFKKTSNDANSTNSNSFTKLVTEINNIKEDLTKKDQHFNSTNESVQTRFNEIFQNLGSLRQSSESLPVISDKIEKLTGVFFDKKKRGNLGEYLLGTILENIFGSNKSLWKAQHKLDENGTIDAIIFTSENKENIGIDSKFPLDNYNKYNNSDDQKIKDQYLKDFKNDIKTHINKVEHYISPLNKISSVMLFIPSESIFAFIFSELDDVIFHAFKKRVWITSPTTLAAALFIVNQQMKETHFIENIGKIKQQLLGLKVELTRWNDRWEPIKKIVLKDLPDRVNEMNISQNKIAQKYEKIFDKTEITEEAEIELKN